MRKDVLHSKPPAQHLSRPLDHVPHVIQPHPVYLPIEMKTRANTTRGLDNEHMIKARAHKGGVRIGKTPKKLASICCP
jgi:hypothetical protein